MVSIYQARNTSDPCTVIQVEGDLQFRVYDKGDAWNIVRAKNGASNYLIVPKGEIAHKIAEVLSSDRTQVK